jgi:hypothetical protein
MAVLRGSWVGLCLIAALASRAGAQAEPLLPVTRGPGAEGCPDAAALLARIERLRVRPLTEPTGYEVRFTREGDGFAAQIRARAGGARRELRDRGQTCAALEQAAAVTLALLLDVGARESSRSRLAVPTRRPIAAPRDAAAAADVGAASSVTPRARDDAASDARDGATHGTRVSATLLLGGAGLIGVVRPLAPALIGELGVEVGRVRVSAGLLLVPRQQLAHGPGTVRASLLGGVARGCFVAARGPALRLQLCSGVHAGVLDARAESYTRNDGVTKPWLALPFEVALGSAAASVGWELGATALAPLLRHDFTIDGVGVAYESLPVGVLLALRGVGVWSL